jgi:hypothetical protein
MIIDKLPGNLENTELLLKRWAAAKQKKDLWRSLYQDCYQYALPSRETFSWTTEGQNRENRLYDSTLQEATYSAANTMCATLFPSWTRWGNAVVAAAVEADDVPSEVVLGLQKATQIFFDCLNQSNFSLSINEVALDLQIGTGALQFDEGDDEMPFVFTSIPTPAIEIEEGPHGTAETKYICRKPQVRFLERMYPGMESFDWPESLREALLLQPEKEVEIIQMEIYHPENKHYYGVVLAKAEKAVIYRVDYGTSCPTIVARSTKTPGETYGRGRVTRALSDAKTLDKMVEFVLRHAAVQIAPPMTGVSDGVLNPYTATLAPNTVIPVASNDSGNPSLKTLDLGGNLAFSEQFIDKLRERVRRTMLGPEPLPNGTTPPSATQVSVFDRDRLWTMNGEYSRVQTELLVPTFLRGLFILQKKGMVPQFKVDGRLIKLMFSSPFAKSQNTDDVLALTEAMGLAAQLGPQVVNRAIKTEDIPAWVFNKKGVDAALIRTKEELVTYDEDAKKVMGTVAEAGAQDGGAAGAVNAVSGLAAVGQ